MIYGNYNFTVTFPGILGSVEGVEGFGPPDQGVRGPEWSKAGVGAIFHSDKINSSLKGAKSRQRSSFCSKAYPGPQRSKETFLKSDRPSF